MTETETVLKILGDRIDELNIKKSNDFTFQTSAKIDVLKEVVEKVKLYGSTGKYTLAIKTNHGTFYLSDVTNTDDVLWTRHKDGAQYWYEYSSAYDWLEQHDGIGKAKIVDLEEAE